MLWVTRRTASVRWLDVADSGWGTDTVIAPDVAFVWKERHPETIEGWPEFGPDLAVGILSADGGAAWVARKVAHYFAAGTSVVWVVDPESETVDVYERSGSFRTLTADDIIDAPGLLPGFAVPVRTLFE